MSSNHQRTARKLQKTHGVKYGAALAAVRSVHVEAAEASKDTPGYLAALEDLADKVLRARDRG